MTALPNLSNFPSDQQLNAPDHTFGLHLGFFSFHECLLLSNKTTKQSTVCFVSLTKKRKQKQEVTKLFGLSILIFCLFCFVVCFSSFKRKDQNWWSGLCGRVGGYFALKLWFENHKTQILLSQVFKIPNISFLSLWCKTLLHFVGFGNYPASKLTFVRQKNPTFDSTKQRCSWEATLSWCANGLKGQSLWYQRNKQGQTRVWGKKSLLSFVCLHENSLLDCCNGNKNEFLFCLSQKVWLFWNRKHTHFEKQHKKQGRHLLKNKATIVNFTFEIDRETHHPSFDFVLTVLFFNFLVWSEKIVVFCFWERRMFPFPLWEEPCLWKDMTHNRVWRFGLDVEKNPCLLPLTQKEKEKERKKRRKRFTTECVLLVVAQLVYIRNVPLIGWRQVGHWRFGKDPTQRSQQRWPQGSNAVWHGSKQTTQLNRASVSSSLRRVLANSSAANKQNTKCWKVTKNKNKEKLQELWHQVHIHEQRASQCCCDQWIVGSENNNEIWVTKSNNQKTTNKHKKIKKCWTDLFCKLQQFHTLTTTQIYTQQIPVFILESQKNSFIDVILSDWLR